MPIYVHKNGHNYGPYNPVQVRQYLSAGNFTGNDLACHDGANWIKLSQVLGINAEPKKPSSESNQFKPKKKKQLRKVRLIFISICVFLFLLLIGSSTLGLIKLMLSDKIEPTASVASNENLFILSPDQVVDVYDGDTFKIDLPSMHPLFGDDLSIRLFGVDTPEMRGTTDEIKALALQAQELTEKALKGASKIELRNPQRGKYFRIVSEVWIDEESLAMILKKQNLAKDYDGTGPRPEW
jgi:endonuclease YncB( thermonuclease family)